MIKRLIDKFLTREIITYLIAGVLTTLVNLICTYICYNLLAIDENITTIISWIFAVAFAYWINNYWVFLAGNEGSRKEAEKIGKFVLARLFTYVVEALGIFIFVTKLQYSMWLIKVILMVIVTILNYVFSKLLIFIKKNEEDGKVDA